jgi:hypothetical protein
VGNTLNTPEQKYKGNADAVVYTLDIELTSARRLESTSPRQDFLTNVVEKVKSGEVPLEEMAAHSSTLM